MNSHVYSAAEVVALSELRNVGKATLANLQLLGIDSVALLAKQNSDNLYTRLCQLTGTRQDPCVHDVFTAVIHQAKTGDPQNWWEFSSARKARQIHGDFPRSNGVYRNLS